MTTRAISVGLKPRVIRIFPILQQRSASSNEQHDEPPSKESSPYARSGPMPKTSKMVRREDSEDRTTNSLMGPRSPKSDSSERHRRRPAVERTRGLAFYGSGLPDVHTRDGACNDQALNFRSPFEDRVVPIGATRSTGRDTFRREMDPQINGKTSFRPDLVRSRSPLMALARAPLRVAVCITSE